MTPTSSKIKALTANLRTAKAKAENPDVVSGVIYGKKQSPISISVNRLDINRIHDFLGHSTVFDVEIEGQDSISVLLHDVQRRPNSNEIIHFDLYAITKGQKVKTEAPIHFEGESAVETDAEKVIATITDTIEIEALPKDLPDQITIDISDLQEVGDSKTVADIKLPDSVTILTDPDTIIIKIDQARQEEPEPQEELPEEESADGEQQTAADEGGDQGSDSETDKESSESE